MGFFPFLGIIISMKILFIGDIVGKLGRRVVEQVLLKLREDEKIDFVLANAENVTHGRGAKLKHLRELQSYGIDLFTSGDHIFYLDKDEPFSDPSVPIIRPANYPSSTPGEGYKILRTQFGKIAVINLLGMTYLGEKIKKDTRNAWIEGEIANPFETIEEISGGLKKGKPDLVVLVDFHAEITSEKRAMGFFLDGKVTAVLGTHTHVPTADAQILLKGTGYVTDVGMCGAKESVLGVAPEIIIKRLAEGAKDPFEWVEKGPAVFNSVLFETNSKGLTKGIKRIDRMVG